MKAVLEFQLPEDKEEFERATKAVSYSLVLWDLDRYLKRNIELTMTTDNDDSGTYQKVRDELFEILYKHNINID